jgi:hypothetical protein
MGEVIRFSEKRGSAHSIGLVGAKAKPATIVILPAVRIERNTERPNDFKTASGSARRGRRRRVAR